MGNSSSNNDDFSKNPNFNMQQHQQAMQRLGSNYVPIDLNVPQPRAQARNQSAHLTQFQRTCYIYKTSIEIQCSGHGFTLQFEYDSQEGNLLEVYAMVKDVIQNDKQYTIRVESDVKSTQELPPGRKLKFKKEYPISSMAGFQSGSVIIRMVTNHDQNTQYSLRRIKTGSQLHWKVLLEKLQQGGRVNQLVNIFKGEGESNECIICLCEEANTLIEPCNHLCMCSECVKPVQQSTNKCPICRRLIQKFKTIVRDGAGQHN